MTRPRRTTVALLLFAVTLGVCAQLASFDFVSYDDPDYVTANPYVTAAFTREERRHQRAAPAGSRRCGKHSEQKGGAADPAGLRQGPEGAASRADGPGSTGRLSPRIHGENRNPQKW